MRSFSYLASGQVSQDVRDPSNTYTFAANDNGRNASASLSSSTVGSYLYNAFEQRVQKVAGGVTTRPFSLETDDPARRPKRAPGRNDVSQPTNKPLKYIGRSIAG